MANTPTTTASVSARCALAELAERLYNINDYNRYPTIMELNDIRSAQRIVAELAKVKPNRVGWPKTIELADAYENCRAIAEEGK